VFFIHSKRPSFTPIKRQERKRLNNPISSKRDMTSNRFWRRVQISGMIYVAVHIGGRLSLDYLAGGVGKIDLTVRNCVPVYKASYHRNRCCLYYTTTHITIIVTFNLKRTKKIFSSHCIFIRTFVKQSTVRSKYNVRHPITYIQLYP